MQLQTSRFGTLEIDETGIVTFPDGLPGFESHRRFVFVPHRMPDADRESPFIWFQSMEDGRLAFLMTSPSNFFADYMPQIPPADYRALGAEEDSNLRLFALLSVPAGNPSGITANLLAPIVVNVKTNCARQVIVNDDRYTLRHRLIPESTPTQRPIGVSSRPATLEPQLAR